MRANFAFAAIVASCEDFPGWVLRIKGGPSTNPGKVPYEVIVLPPPR